MNPLRVKLCARVHKPRHGLINMKSSFEISKFILTSRADEQNNCICFPFAGVWSRSPPAEFNSHLDVGILENGLDLAIVIFYTDNLSIGAREFSGEFAR